MLIGYARASTEDQDLTLQRSALERSPKKSSRFARVLADEPGSKAGPHSLHVVQLLHCFCGFCIEKVVHHRDDDGHALHEGDVCCIGQNGQSRC